MALSIDDEPLSWAARGQKIMFRVSSDNTAQDGFKYGVEVVNSTTAKSYFFLYDPDPANQFLYFDLNPLLVMANEEYSINPHATPFTTPIEEPQGSGYDQYVVKFTEWWIEFGELTEQIGSMDQITQFVFNGYYQQSDGYKPDADGGEEEVRIAINSSTKSRLWSDRFRSTHTWDYSSFFGQNNAIFIPCLENDYGSLACQTKLSVMKSNEAYGYDLFFFYGDPESPTMAAPYIGALIPFCPFQHIGVYPMNLNNGVGNPSPLLYPDWLFYYVRIRNSAGAYISQKYVFYNAERFGQYDCRHDRIRLAWVCSRAGYDYQNFIKKSEYTNQIDRKNFVRPLFNGTQSIFYTNMRTKIDRQNFVDRTLTISSDWIQEEEFIFLRSLLVSNQVSMIKDDGSSIPVSIDDSTYVERRSRDGKLVNLTLKINISYDYWS